MLPQPGMLSAVRFRARGCASVRVRCSGFEAKLSKISVFEENKMTTQSTKTINMPELPQSAPEQFKQRKRQELGQFRLQVDRQTKGSYATFEEAEEAGIVIKKGYPKLHVAVYDALKSVDKLIELPTN
jgi:hypothetical protein